ncbi:ribonuclease P protein component [Pleurocapsales cyanobacterium LEGE 06147]|nr:ribonuclease P protein component [Pleurocapsales cyanobacterium LEGE 06147]
MGLPKANRLRNRRDFRAVYEQGIRRYGSHLTLRALQVNDRTSPSPSNPPLIGISVSQKVSKKAVIRNRIKRQIRGAIRELLPLISPNWKIAIVVRPGAAECKYEHFLRELKQLLVEAKIVINGN